jgi:hypothetical protein
MRSYTIRNVQIPGLGACEVWGQIDADGLGRVEVLTADGSAIPGDELVDEQIDACDRALIERDRNRDRNPHPALCGE